MKMYEATIIIPAYNEGKNIRDVIQRVRNVSSKYQIIVVDDGSQDRTAGLARQEKVKVITLEKNSGKAFACLTGSSQAGCEKIVFIDADLQLSPEEIPKFVSALDICELAIGVRDMKAIPLQRRLANILARKMVSHGSQQLHDVLCGFRAVRKSALKKMSLKQRRYEFESEMLLAALKNHMKIKEVSVTVSYESYKGMSVIDSLRVLLYILKNRTGK
ncbi:MAG: glycosyltransferase family 2 protein [Candidatus Aenigmarchaeota archaeon]|nr:glycosyltransferase family 2 protein [Candidatus Aenigmarchaeota archaeon]